MATIRAMAVIMIATLMAALGIAAAGNTDAEGSTVMAPRGDTRGQCVRGRLRLTSELKVVGIKHLYKNEIGIGNIGYHFGGGSEDDGQLSPIHGQGQ
jgi:hypothetical protein